LVAVERGGLTECSVVEETLGPSRTGVAERWSRVGGALQVEHTVSAKKTGVAEEWARWFDEQRRDHG
jgi:hypothetical protein